MISIYNFAFSTLLLLGSPVVSEITNLNISNLSQQDETQQVLVAASKNKQKPCTKQPKPKQITHRGSGRVESDQQTNPSTNSKFLEFKNNQIDSLIADKSDADKDQPGGDARRAHRGSGRIEEEKDNTQKSSNSQIIAESTSEDNKEEAHRGSGRLEA